MPFLIFILLEIFGFWYLVEAQGFLVTMAIYWLPTILGVYLIKSYSTQNFEKLRAEVANGNQPAKSSLHMMLKFVGAIFLCFPFMASRFVGLFLLFPLTRMLLILFGELWLVKKLFKSPMMNFASFNFGNGGFKAGGFSFGGGQNPFGAMGEELFKNFRDSQQSSQTGLGDFDRTADKDDNVIDVDFVEVKEAGLLKGPEGKEKGKEDEQQD